LRKSSHRHVSVKRKEKDTARETVGGWNDVVIPASMISKKRREEGPGIQSRMSSAFSKNYKEKRRERREDLQARLEKGN